MIAPHKSNRKKSNPGCAIITPVSHTLENLESVGMVVKHSTDLGSP